MPVRCSFKVVVTFVLMMLLIAGLISFSIYIIQQKNTSIVITTTSTVTNTTNSIFMSATTVSVSSIETGKLFEIIHIFLSLSNDFRNGYCPFFCFSINLQGAISTDINV